MMGYKSYEGLYSTLGCTEVALTLIGSMSLLKDTTFFIFPVAAAAPVFL